MKIAVNTRLLLEKKLEGIGWFTYETLQRITKNHPEHEFIFIFDRPYDPKFVFSDNVTPVVAHPQSRHPILWYLFFEYSIPYILHKYKADLFVSTDAWVSLHTKVPTVNVIHDLNFEHHPEFIKGWLTRKYYSYYPRKYALKSDRIATVSEFTKQDIGKTYGILPDKIDVVYNGCNEIYQPLNEVEKQKVREEYSEGKPYFIFVGSIHKRKNVDNLLRAFDLFRENDSNETKLVIVGSKMWKVPQTEAIFQNMKHKDSVIFTGHMTPLNLSRMVASAEALTLVSFFEGFGIPIIEAFNCETPVITSNTSSMPEVAKDAALLIDPYSSESIAEAMHKVAENKELRSELIAKGNIRKKDFSWDKTAEKLWNCIDKVLKDR